MTRRAFALVGSWLGLSLLPLTIIFDGHNSEPLAVAVSDGLGYVGLLMLAWQFILNARTRTLDELFGAKAVHSLHRYGTYLALILLAAHPAILFVLDPARYLPLLDLLIAPWRARAAVASAALLVLLVLLSWKWVRGRFNPKRWRSLHRTAGVTVVALGLLHIVLVGHYTTGWEGAALVTVVLGATLLPMVWVREPVKKPTKKPAALLPRLYFGLGLHRVSQTLIVLLMCGAASLLLAGRVMLAANVRSGASLPRAGHVMTPSTAPPSSMPGTPRAGDGGGRSKSTSEDPALLGPPDTETGQAVSASPARPPTGQSAAPISPVASPAIRAPAAAGSTSTPTPRPGGTPSPLPTATPAPPPP
jgi:hypothetical protein